MKIYIAASWKHCHLVRMLGAALHKHEVLLFTDRELGHAEANFDDWCESNEGEECFLFDINGAMTSDLVIYVGPSGTDAWAEVGAAYASHVKIVGLYAKGEQAGLMRRMVSKWYDNVLDLLEELC